MEPAYPPLSVEEIEDLLARRTGPSRREMRSLLVRALSTAKQLREVRSAYDLEMRARVAAAGAGRRAFLDPSQVVAFLSSDQRAKLLTQMEKDRLEAHDLLNRQLEERSRRLADLILAAETVLSSPEEERAAALAPLLVRMREEAGEAGGAGETGDGEGLPPSPEEAPQGGYGEEPPAKPDDSTEGEEPTGRTDEGSTEGEEPTGRTDEGSTEGEEPTDEDGKDSTEGEEPTGRTDEEKK